MTTDHDTLINKAEAARLAGVSVRTVDRWLASGLLTRYRRGPTRAVWVDRDELMRLIEPLRKEAV